MKIEGVRLFVMMFEYHQYDIWSIIKMKEECLWCLPYDTDSVFKPFLKIPFSVYLNNLISNEHFPAYQASAAI